MRGYAVLALHLLAQSVPAVAHAEGGPALHWVRLPGAESCIPAGELAQRVEARLERSVFVLPQHAELSFEGFVQPRPEGGFTASLAVSNVQGQVLGARQLESPDADCRALDEALVLITALTLFPGDFGLDGGGIALDEETNARLQALFGDEPSELDPGALPDLLPPEQLPPAESMPEAAAEGEPEPARLAGSARTRFSIEAAPIAGFGVLPGVALGISVEATLGLAGTWPIRLGFAHFFERSARAEALPLGTGYFARDELSLFACPLSPDRPITLELCAGGVFGIIAARSEGFAEGGIDAADPVVDLGGQVGLRVLFLDHLLTRATVTALLPLVQRGYEYQALDASSETLFRTSQIGLRLQIGAGLEF